MPRIENMGPVTGFADEHCIHVDDNGGARCCFCGQIFALHKGTEGGGHGPYSGKNAVIDLGGSANECYARVTAGAGVS